ncbi:major facilitator superfamily transporter [Asaia krungthepensis NRIC 0535]|uniref:Major facilitator superfamily transporter n=2 Tax=Asaia krungthepensis TaxID=220990 RepID=A0ABQ0Q5R4_9PROT|nr:major facilitator superfamily transporter [Asaia krungthepensis NRIC 0535]
MPIVASAQNGLLTGNIGSAAGEAGLTTAEAEWLIAAFVGAAAFANLVVIKGRQQFGIMFFLTTLLGVNVLTGLLLILFPSFTTLTINRVSNGLMVSTNVAGGVYYLIQALPKSHRVLAIAIAIACLQMANPIAALFPVEMLTRGSNHGFACLATAMGALQLILVLLLPLPRTNMGRVFEGLDALSAVLLCGVSVCLASFLTLGKTMWWTDTPWIGWLLIGTIGFAAAAFAFESCRTRPLLQISWLSTGTILRFAIVAIVERLLLSEQTTGATGLLSQAGLLNDQYHTLYLFVILGMVTGTTVMGLTLSARAIPFQCVAALLAIAFASWMDAGSNALTRPVDMYFSQALLGFGTTLFVGPALLYGVILVLKSDTSHFISTIYVFAITQSVGSVTGAALLGSLQYYYERYAMVGFASRLSDTASSSLAASKLGLSSLSSTLNSQASVMGYLNLFGFVSVFALAAAGLILGILLCKHLIDLTNRRFS